jgi:hypothetical protein
MIRETSAGPLAAGAELVASVTQAVADGMAAIDFEDTHSLLTGGERLLRYAAEPSRLAALLSRPLKESALLAKCERFNLFEKIVLYEDPVRRSRLRLHLFGDEVEEVHHHRASFASLVLRGSYTHLLYGDEKSLGDSAGGVEFRPLFAQEQRPGSSYALHHAMMHATLAKPETVTLMLQAPTARRSFRIYDLKTGRRRDREGGEYADRIQEEGELPITEQRVREIFDTLRRWGLV